MPTPQADTAERPDRDLVHPGRYYLWAGIALLAISAGGFVPISLLLGKPSFAAPRTDRTGEIRVVERPDGSRLHVEIYGRTERPTIVFTHGWSLDRTAWFYQVQAMAERYRVVIWDLPGLGRSKGPHSGDFSLTKLAGDLEAVVQIAGKGPIILVGHSIGGMIVQTLCRLHHEQLGPRIGGLVLVHTTYTNPLRTIILAQLWKALEKPVLVPLNYLMMWLAPLAWLSNMQSFLNGSLHVTTRLTSFAGQQTWGQVHYGAWLMAKAWPGVLARGNFGMIEFDAQKTLPTIDIPVLVIGGEHDRMTKVAASRHISQAIATSTLATVPAGHLGYWECHGQVTELIAEFAEQLAEQHIQRAAVPPPHPPATRTAPKAS